MGPAVLLRCLRVSYFTSSEFKDLPEQLNCRAGHSNNWHSHLGGVEATSGLDNLLLTHAQIRIENDHLRGLFWDYHQIEGRGNCYPNRVQGLSDRIASQSSPAYLM